MHELDFALALGALAKIRNTSLYKDYRFSPVALDWRLSAEEAAQSYWKLSFRDCKIAHDQTDIAPMTNQPQPKLKATTVTVLENHWAARGTKILLELSRFAFRDLNPEVFIREHNIGIGITHAHQVAEYLMVAPTIAAQMMTRVTGESSVGRSLFVLLDYLRYKSHTETVGTPTIGWLEVRIIGNHSEGRDIAVTLHKTPEVMIPQLSLVAVANMKWFRPPYTRD